MAADISCPRKDNGRRFLLLWFRIFYPAEENRLESDKEEGEVVDPSIHLSILASSRKMMADIKIGCGRRMGNKLDTDVM